MRLGAGFEKSWGSKSHIHTQSRRNFRTKEKYVIFVIQKRRGRQLMCAGYEIHWWVSSAQRRYILLVQKKNVRFMNSDY
jgi:hypothetical protein